MELKQSVSGGGVVCPNPSSCGPDQKYDEGDERGQGEPMSQCPPKCSRRGSEETDSNFDDEKEKVCHEPMEEEEVELTIKPRVHKDKKRKKRKHLYGGERVAVKDGEGFIPQYCNLPPGTATVMVQASGVVMLKTVKK